LTASCWSSALNVEWNRLRRGPASSTLVPGNSSNRALRSAVRNVRPAATAVVAMMRSCWLCGVRAHASTPTVRRAPGPRPRHRARSAPLPMPRPRRVVSETVLRLRQCQSQLVFRDRGHRMPRGRGCQGDGGSVTRSLTG